MKKTKLAIVIITYNQEKLICKQVECIRKFCKDNFAIVVIDNSTKQETTEAIKYYCTQLDIELIKTSSSSKNGSDSHSFAANLSYTILKDKYDYFFYLDHDCFPVKEFSVMEILENQVFAGIGQQKSELYLWPGCLMLDNRKVDEADIDFSPCNKRGLDTGGNMFRAIKEYGAVLFNEVYEQNPYFPSPPYNFYSMINDSMFMHFINSSNWNETEGNESRVNSLINILEEKIK